MLKSWLGGKRRPLKCAAVTPVGPGHAERALECRASIEAAWQYGRGPFSDLEFCIVDDSKGELGRSKARNSGVERARRAGADWIFFLDADDLMAPRAFEIFAQYERQFDAVWGLIALKPPNEPDHHIRFPQALTLRSLDELLLLDPFLTLVMGHFVRTETAVSLPFNEAMNAGEDFDWYVRAWEKYRCAKLVEILAIVRADSHSTGPRAATADQWRSAATACLDEGMKARGLDRDSSHAISAVNRVSAEAQAFSRARTEASADTLGMFAARLPYRGLVDVIGCAGGDCVLFSDNDDPVALSLGWIGEYQPASTRLWQLLCNDAALILDVGASTGYFTLLAARAAPQSAIACFESTQAGFARLQRNLELNDVRNAEAIWLASAGDCASSVSNYLEQRENTVASAVRIGESAPAARAIDGLARMLARGTPDLLIAAGAAEWAGPVESALRGHGYRFFAVDEAAETIRPAGGLEPAAGFHSVNRWATKRSAGDVQNLIKAAYCSGGA